MDADQLRAFVQVADDLHFGRAALRLHRSVSAVSRAVRNLEREVGSSLFHRDRNTVRLTADGRRLLPPARDLLQRFDTLPGLLGAAPRALRPTLRVGVSSCGDTLPVDAALEHLEQRLGDDVILRVSMGSSAEVLDGVAEGSLDLGAVHSPVLRRPLRGATLFRYPWAVAMDAGHRLASRSRLTPADLGGSRAVLVEPQLPADLLQEVLATLTAAGVTPEEAPADPLQAARLVRRQGHVALLRHPRYGGAGASILASDRYAVAELDGLPVDLTLALTWHEATDLHRRFPALLPSLVNALAAS